MRFRRWNWLCLMGSCAGLMLSSAVGAEPKSGKSKKSPPASSETASPPWTAEQITERTRPSLVVLSARGRDGNGEGVGTGFVIDT